MLEDMSEKVRHLIAVFLALALVVAGTAQLVQASDMAVKMSVGSSASEMPMPGGCGGCSGGDDSTPMACFAVCSSTITAILPSTLLVAFVALASPTVRVVTAITGHHGPPDPYPPRPTNLG